MSASGTSLLRRMDASDLEQVLHWRNNDAVRRHLYSTHDIGAGEHRAWFLRKNADPQHHLMILERDGSPCGFVQFGPVSPGRVAEWGFYVAPGAPPGTGARLGQAALAYAFDTVGLHKVCGETLAGNDRSISFHLKLGFREEGRLVEQHFDGSGYHDVIRLGLLSGQWHANGQVERGKAAG